MVKRACPFKQRPPLGRLLYTGAQVYNEVDTNLGPKPNPVTSSSPNQPRQESKF